MRHDLKKTFGVLFLVALLSFTSTNAETPPSLWTRTNGEDWPNLLGPRGDGTSVEKGVDPALWQPHPKLLWSLPLGVSYGGPTIAVGRLLQFDRFGDHERLTCYNAETAEELWRWEHGVQYEDAYGYNNGPRCSPVIDEDRVYTLGVNGFLACVQLADGKLLWEIDTTQKYGVIPNFFGVASTPRVFDELLIVMIGGSPAASQSLTNQQLELIKPNGSAIVAFDKRTGREVYRVGKDLASYASLTIQKIGDQVTCLAFLRSGLLAFDPATGKELFKFHWRASLRDSVNAAVPIVQGKQILLSEAYEIGSAMLDVAGKSPKVVWSDADKSTRDQSLRAHWATPVCLEGFVYGCSGRNQPDSDFRCIRWSDGKPQWAVRRHERSSVLAVDGYLIVLGEYGRLELVRPSPEKFNVVATVALNQVNDPRDGRSLLKYPCWAAPIISHGLLYVRGHDRLLCFDLIPAT